MGRLVHTGEYKELYDAKWNLVAKDTFALRPLSPKPTDLPPAAIKGPSSRCWVVYIWLVKYVWVTISELWLMLNHDHDGNINISFFQRNRKHTAHPAHVARSQLSSCMTTSRPSQPSTTQWSKIRRRRRRRKSPRCPRLCQSLWLVMWC